MKKLHFVPVDICFTHSLFHFAFTSVRVLILLVCTYSVAAFLLNVFLLKKDGKLLLSNHLKADTCGSELICVLLIWSQLLHYASFCHVQIQSSQRQDNKLQVTDLTSKTGP